MRNATILSALALATVLAAPASAQAPKDTELLFGGFGGTLQRAMQTQVIRPFERKFGVKVVYVTGTANEMLAKVRAQGDHPQIDVIWLTETSHDQGNLLGVFEKVGVDAVPNMADLVPSARPASGVGVIMGTQALALEYNTKAFKEHGWAPPAAWSDLWDPKFKGHVVSYNVPIGYATGFLGLINVLHGGTGSNLDPGFAEIARLVPNVMAFVDPPAQVDALFATGGAWIGYNGSGRIGDLAATGAPVAMVMPKEGALSNPDFFDVVRNAPHKALAMQFIDFVLSAEMQAVVAKSMNLAPVNAKTRLEAETEAALGMGPQGAAGLKQIDMATIDANIEAITQRWNEMVAHK